MAAVAFPKIRFSIISGEMGRVNEPDHVRIVNREVQEGIGKAVVMLAESIAKDHVYHLGEEFRGAALARITFSVERGIVFESCTDPRLQECYFRNSQHVIPMPKSMAPSSVHQIDSTPELLDHVPPNLSKDVVFVDATAVLLHEQGLDKPQTVELEIVPFIPLTKGRGLTTSSLRFPHLLLDLLKRLEQGQLAPDSSVCIIGPGLMEYEDPNILPACPQFAELLAMIPGGKFTLLDINKPSLQLLSRQYARNFTAYDPMAFRSYTLESGVGEFVESSEYQKLFEVMRGNFAQLAVAPNNATEMLKGIGPLQPLFLRVDSNQLALRVFDITKSSFKKEDQFDVMVATMSIVNAYQDEMSENPHMNYFGKLTKFLEALKVGGTLYLDSVMIQYLLDVAGREGFDLGIQYLEAMIGNRLQLEKISFEGFKEGATGALNTITALSMYPPKGIDRQAYSTTTSDLWAITRTNEQVDPAQKGQIALQLLQLLRSQPTAEASSSS